MNDAVLHMRARVLLRGAVRVFVVMAGHGCTVSKRNRVGRPSGWWSHGGIQAGVRSNGRQQGP